MAKSEMGRDKFQRAKLRPGSRTAQVGERLIIDEGNGKAAGDGAEASG